jgi:tRNA1(Val) A37 N6-methylase TrmN6
MTPANVAHFMAALFPKPITPICHLLDAGAGKGALSCAFLDRWTSGDISFESVDVTAFEIDAMLSRHLVRNLAAYHSVDTHVFEDDYIAMASSNMRMNPHYTHVLLNPPYKKINSKSHHRRILRSIGIEAVNMYSAFVALALSQTAPGGQLVAIIPRSFCNGPYYKPFRNFLLERAAIRHIHLFDSRSLPFKADSVLQENIIIRVERAGQQGSVKISTSTDATFSDLIEHTYPFEQIVFPDSRENIIHVPTSPKENAIACSSTIRYTLDDLGSSPNSGKEK